MSEQPVIVAPALFRAMVEPQLPAGVEAHWFSSADELMALAPRADIGWFDQFTLDDCHEPALAATKLRWLHTTLAGLSDVPIDAARERGLIVTSGSGLTAALVADFALLGVLALARRFADLVRAHDRGNWLATPPDQDDLDGTHALVIGYGSIGRGIGARLAACGVAVTGVRRHGDPAAGVIGADAWRARLGKFDWVILATPDTPDTRHLLGAAEIAAMKAGARLVNIARGTLVDQDALLAALTSGALGGAMLDVTEPEPLPADHPLWAAPNCLITMHMAGRFTPAARQRAAARFVRNVRAYLAGAPLEAQVDLSRGY